MQTKNPKLTEVNRELVRTRQRIIALKREMLDNAWRRGDRWWRDREAALEQQERKERFLSAAKANSR